MQPEKTASNGFSISHGREVFMRLSSKIALLSLITTTGGAPAAAPDNDDGATTVGSKISEVTIYADRARVTRSAAVTIRPQTATFAFRKLPGWIDEGSVRVSISPPESAELLDVQVEKTFL